MFIKAWAFFTPVLSPPTAGPPWKAITYSVSYVPVFLAGIAGLVLCRRRWREWLFIPALFAGFLGSTVLTWGQSRYRLPRDPLLMAAAAVFVVAILRRFGRSTVR